jgi:hypothetical protein
VFIVSTAVDVAAEYPEEQILNQPDDGVDPENQDEEPAAMIEEPPSGINLIKLLMMLFIFLIIESNIVLYI